MIVRDATPADTDRLSALARTSYAAAFGHSFSPSDLAAHLDAHLTPARVAAFIETDTVLVAENEGDLAGFIQLGAVKPAAFGDHVAPGDWELRRIYVLAAFQNQGLGRRLIDAALARLPSPTPGVVLDVWEENPRARALYERYGFAVIAKRPFLVRSGAPTTSDLIMRRPGSPDG